MKKNDCKQCPYYGSYYDSFTCDGDEWCNCGIYENDYPIIKGCSYPLFVRKILVFKEKMKDKIYGWLAQRNYERALKRGEIDE